MEVNGLVMYWDDKFGHHRIWMIKSICLGSEKQESLIELVSLTENAGIDVDGEKHLTTWVPEPLLRNYFIYKQFN